MSDDTTTWLKKNPAINPLRRSLKTSLRFHVPNSDMNTSIMSNPDKVKDQGLFIPRMLQRANMQMRKSRAHEFKVPELVVTKPGKKEVVNSGVRPKKVPTPNRARKSFLPVPKLKGQSNEKPTVKSNMGRPSMAPGAASGRRTAKRDLLKKVVELSEIKRKEEEAESQLKASGDSSVLRSILKKRASLRRTSQISSTRKPKAKKVLFDGFENSDGEKENEGDTRNDFNTAMDEPTVFLNFPKGVNSDESIQDLANDTKHRHHITKIIQLWESYKENLENLESERNSFEDSFEVLLEHTTNFQKEYKAYKETSKEMYNRLADLRREIEENLKKVLSGEEPEMPKPKRRSTGRRSSEKIKMSDKSKVIKKTSARKSVPLLKKDFLTALEDSFSLVSNDCFFDK